LQSTWPLADIWLQHQDAYGGEIDIDMGRAQCVAVHRRGMRVEAVALSEAECAFWRSAQASEPLGEMLEAAFAIDPGFDVQATLHEAFMREFIVRLSSA
jgi:hypothetical protein